MRGYGLDSDEELSDEVISEKYHRDKFGHHAPDRSK